MSRDDDTRNSGWSGGLGAIFRLGFSVAFVSAVTSNTVGLFFMEFGDELCQEMPVGTVLSDGWSCNLRLEGVALGLALFGLYGLPLGLIVAWAGYRSGFIEYFDRLRPAYSTKWVVIHLSFIVIAGITVAIVTFPGLLFLVPRTNLMLIPVVAVAAAGIAITILIDYRRTKSRADC